MSGGFVKLYASVVTSSVWAESPITKLAWLTLLIIADADGRIEGTVPGVARLIGISVPDFEAALAVFLAPDRYSRTKTDDGRRLREIDGGWELVNHRAYREKRSPKQVRQAEWLASKRESTKNSTESTPVDMSTNVDRVDAQRSEDRDQIEDISSGSAAPEPDHRAPFDAPEGKTEPKDGTDATRAAVAEVFACWRETHGSNRAKLAGPRATRIKSRLREGYTVEQLRQAILGALKDPWLMGTAPKSERSYRDLKHILRDAEQVERLIALKEGAGRTPTRPNGGATGTADEIPGFIR